MWLMCDDLGPVCGWMWVNPLMHLMWLVQEFLFLSSGILDQQFLQIFIFDCCPPSCYLQSFPKVDQQITKSKRKWCLHGSSNASLFQWLQCNVNIHKHIFCTSDYNSREICTVRVTATTSTNNHHINHFRCGSSLHIPGFVCLRFTLITWRRLQTEQSLPRRHESLTLWGVSDWTTTSS